MCAYDFDMPDVIMKSRLAMLRIVGVLMLIVVLVLGGIGIYMRDKLVYNYRDKQRTKIGSIMKVSGYRQGRSGYDRYRRTQISTADSRTTW